MTSTPRDALTPLFASNPIPPRDRSPRGPSSRDTPPLPTTTTAQVCAEARVEGLPTKLTGAGGGGCLFSLLRTSSETAPLQRRLRRRGFECYTTTVGGQGVLWHGAPLEGALAAERDGDRARRRSRASVLIAASAAAAAIALVVLRRR